MFKEIEQVWFTPMQLSNNLAISSDIYWLRCPIIHPVVFFSFFGREDSRMARHVFVIWFKKTPFRKILSVYAFVYSPECMKYAHWIAKKVKLPWLSIWQIIHQNLNDLLCQYPSRCIETRLHHRGNEVHV
jgi:hypothetical protein